MFIKKGLIMKKILIIQLTLLSIFTANAIVKDSPISKDQQKLLLKCLNKLDNINKIDNCITKSKSSVGIASSDVEKANNRAVLEKLDAANRRRKCDMGPIACDMTLHGFASIKLTEQQAEDILQDLE